MTAQLLIIDPQNDFCDIPGATLPVAGADADMRRLAAFIGAAGEQIQDITITMDTHAAFGIERPGFWANGDGSTVAPFTEITAAQVRAGVYATLEAERATEALAYLDALEAGGRYKLMVWPAHCVDGTWGHRIHGALASAVDRWEDAIGGPSWTVLKGMNPLTEQYSAVRAEVPRDDDRSTQTNLDLLRRVAMFDGLTFIAGEASSHCVSATARDLFAGMTPEKLKKTILLRDCMSPVTGFEAAPMELFRAASLHGVRAMSAAEALTLLGA